MVSLLIFIGLALGGLVLSLWAIVVNPIGALYPPGERHGPVVSTGPYKWFAHPMYLGTVLITAGLAGLAAGWWNVLAVGGLAATLMLEWAARDKR